MRRLFAATSENRAPAHTLGLLLFVLILLPLAVLFFSSSPGELLAGARHPLFAPALWLSARTSLISLAIVVLTGTPLAWWIVRSPPRRGRLVALFVDLPVVIPPAVTGVALLQTFGRQGVLGGALEAFGISLPFSTAAVVLAQIIVSAPFYVQAAANAFRKVDADSLAVARSLGASQRQAFLRIAVPVALPGLLGGAALAWARSLGEFGATLLFAGNLSGTTQTMPLAIYTALESDLQAALAISLALAAFGVVLLFSLRALPALFSRWRARTVDLGLGPHEEPKP
jgi:molybdate transport system permease protein